MSRIFFLGVHPPKHRNIGDFAQTYAIRKWFDNYFPRQQVFEFNKSVSLNKIKAKISRNDLIFINSGGDMGDRYAGWERERAKIVKSLRENRVVSLPQTIYYSNTYHGRRVLRGSAKAYNSHRQLTIMARDSVSYKNALKHFDKSEVILFPDFALYLEAPESIIERKGCLLCMRKDSESKLGVSEKDTIRHLIPMKITEFDTTLKYNITPDKREKGFNETIKLFQSHEVIVTDRFHGMIFSYIAGTPCVALPTQDHKVTSGIKWFNGVKQIKLGSPSQISNDLEQVTSMREPYFRIDFKGKYFKGLKTKLGL